MLVQYVQFRDLYLQGFNAAEPNGGWPARALYQDLARDGAYRLNGTDRSSRDTRTEKRRWTLVAPDGPSLDVAFGALLNEIGNAGRLVGVTPDFLALWTDAELVNARAISAPRRVSGRMRGVGLEIETDFLLNTPDWFEESQQVLAFSDIYDSDAGDMLLMDIMGATPGTPVDMTWFVRGRATTHRIVITLASGTGTVTKLALTNTTTGYSLTWIGSLATGDDLVIDVLLESILNDGADAYDELTLGAHTRWFALAAGINAVTVEIDDTATDDSTVLEIAYYPTYP
jgi:hypothetical protein